MSKMAYTCRQLNSTNTALSYFHVAVLCKLEQAEMVKTGLMKCFDSAEIAYHYDKSKPESPSVRDGKVGLTPCLEAIVIGHWSQSGKLLRDHQKCRHNVFCHNGLDDETLTESIVETFTYSGQTVLDATESGSMAAVKSGRNLVAVFEEGASKQDFLEKVDSD
ncbi:uncharacterized protein LOC135347981 [Halichondria panicea]|uniref:uncharacterized protein LOC135347981 n=1 Tax=Halichondria panicea TaxID=6063 RepID=UPI00312B94E3